MDRKSKRALLTAAASTVAGALVNVVTSGMGATTPVMVLLTVAGIVLLTAVAVLLPAQDSHPPAGERELLAAATERLRDEVQQQWRRNPLWHSVRAADRLPVRWEYADPGQFPGNAGAPVTGNLALVWPENSRFHRLVVLGDAGSGKSELMVSVLRELVEDRRGGRRVAVLVPISSWNPAEQPELDQWLAEWLLLNHRFLDRPLDGHSHRTLAHLLVARGRVAFILDGFDEIAPDSRQRAIDAMNELGELPLLVTSRAEEFPAGPLRGARGLIVQPQNDGDVLGYLRRRSGEPESWDVVEQAYADVRDTLRTPLMVMLADAMHNGPGGRPADMLGHPDLPGYLLTGFLPARYPDRRDAHWLGVLARMPGSELRWWELTDPRTRTPNELRRIAAIALWTAVSAGVLNGWVFTSANVGLTDALRIAAAAVVCYLAAESLPAALIGAAGAYIAGILSGSYDLGVAGGLAAGFAWPHRPSRPRSPARALLAGATVATVAAAVRLLGMLPALHLDTGLTVGFAAGAADGFTTRFDEDVNGWAGTTAIVALIVWAGLRANGTASVKHRYAVPSIAGLMVGAIDCVADQVRRDVVHGWLIGPADGLAVGLAVFVVATYPARPSRILPIAAGVLSFALNTAGYLARRDIHTGWARAAAEAICAATVLWLLANPSPHIDDRPGSLNWHARLTVPAVAVAAIVAVLDGLSAPWSRAIATGTGIGLVVAYDRYRANTSVRHDAVTAGVFATVIAGLTVGFAYGLLYGLVAGLSWRIAQTVARRSLPAVRIWPSAAGTLAGALLGSMAALAAAFNGLPVPWLLLIFATCGTAGAFAFGLTGRTMNARLVTTPGDLYRQDRTAAGIALAVVAVTVGVAVGTRTLATSHRTDAAILATVSTILTYGLTAGLVVAVAATRFPLHALIRARLAARGDLPWALMAFLDDAHRKRGVLRSNGAAYQFRHLVLRKAIADRPS